MLSALEKLITAIVVGLQLAKYNLLDDGEGELFISSFNIAPDSEYYGTVMPHSCLGAGLPKEGVTIVHELYSRS